PGCWVSIYGTSLAPATAVLSTSDLVNGVIPTTLGGVGVRINGKAAYMGYVSPTQLNVLAPADSAAGSVAVTVTNPAGASAGVSTTLQAFLPGLSTVNNYVRAEPAGPGELITLYGTGFGPTNSPLDTGLVFAGAYPMDNIVTVTIGGVAATVVFAGLVGAGLY